MKITCIIPVYNAGEYLNAAIESILQQTFQDFELILIDDRSKDASWETIEFYFRQYPQKIRALKNAHNIGLPATLNRAINESKGTMIARMDQDDIAAPNRFEEQIKAFEKNPDVAIVGTYWKYMNSGVVPQVPTASDEIKVFTLINNPLGHPTVMFKKEKILSSVGFYDESAHNVEDFEFWSRCLDVVKAINIPIPLLDYRIHSTQISTSSASKQHLAAHKIRVRQANKVFRYSPLSEYFINALDKPFESKKSYIKFAFAGGYLVFLNFIFRKFSTIHLAKLIAKKLFR